MQESFNSISLQKLSKIQSVIESSQESFNSISLQKLSKIQSVIESSQEFEANQMKCFALRAMTDSKKAIDSMSCDEVDKFSNDLIEIFKYKNWL